MVLERCPFVGEYLRQPLDDLSHERVGLFDRFARFVHEARLHRLPPRAKASGFVPGEHIGSARPSSVCAGGDDGFAVAVSIRRAMSRVVSRSSHYRSGREIVARHEKGQASTEDLRQAMVHFRALFDELVAGVRPNIRRAS